MRLHPATTVTFTLLFIGAAHSKYSGYKLIRFPADESTASWLDSIQDYAHDVDESTMEESRALFDVMSEPTKLKKYADVVVAPDFFDTFTLMLNKRGIYQVEVLNANIQRDLDDENRKIQAKARRRRRRAITGNALNDFDAENYQAYDSMVDFMRGLERDHPQLVKVVKIATSTEGRVVYGVKISTSNTYKPAIVVDAGVHAREWLAPATATYMIKKLVASFGTDAKLTRSMQQFDWFIIPQVNPDGYEYSRLRDRLWRKTRSRHQNFTNQPWKKNCLGVDANRNWGFEWAGPGAVTSNSCSNIYAGPRAFSEPEIVGLRDFLIWEIPDLKIYFSLHSYGQVLLAPWGYTKKRPMNYQDQRNAARAAVNAIKASGGSVYTYGTISEVMYEAAGTNIDFMANRNVPYIYGVELRPESNGIQGFSIDANKIKPTGDEMLAGILAVADYAAAHNKL